MWPSGLLHKIAYSALIRVLALIVNQSICQRLLATLPHASSPAEKLAPGRLSEWQMASGLLKPTGALRRLKGHLEHLILLICNSTYHFGWSHVWWHLPSIPKGGCSGCELSGRAMSTGKAEKKEERSRSKCHLPKEHFFFVVRILLLTMHIR